MVDSPDPLDRASLKNVLDRLGFDPSAYSLTGGHPSEAYVLEQRGPDWVVFYSARDLETGLVYLPSEALACRHLAGLLADDPTTRT